MRLLIAATLLVLLLPLGSHAQNLDLVAEEAALREAVQRGPRYAEDVIRFSSVYRMPYIRGSFLDGAEAAPDPEARLEERRNSRRSGHQLIRLEMAASADLAYEVSRHVLSWEMDDTGETYHLPRSSLIVWRKEGGEWKEAAEFIFPEDRVPARP
jgi:ketosteroid isomerase-like protein